MSKPELTLEGFRCSTMDDGSVVFVATDLAVMNMRLPAPDGRMIVIVPPVGEKVDPATYAQLLFPQMATE